uniref:Uncharacterized protein n=1 Tax=Lygus hesperus TaxID=30085 RepID=A0A146M344_LYGHE
MIADNKGRRKHVLVESMPCHKDGHGHSVGKTPNALVMSVLLTDYHTCQAGQLYHDSYRMYKPVHSTLHLLAVTRSALQSLQGESNLYSIALLACLTVHSHNFKTPHCHLSRCDSVYVRQSMNHQSDMDVPTHNLYNMDNATLRH